MLETLGVAREAVELGGLRDGSRERIVGLLGGGLRWDVLAEAAELVVGLSLLVGNSRRLLLRSNWLVLGNRRKTGSGLGRRNRLLDLGLVLNGRAGRRRERSLWLLSWRVLRRLSASLCFLTVLVHIQ